MKLKLRKFFRTEISIPCELCEIFQNSFDVDHRRVCFYKLRGIPTHFFSERDRSFRESAKKSEETVRLRKMLSPRN